METNNKCLDRFKLLETLNHEAFKKESSNILLAGPWGSGKTSLLREVRKPGDIQEKEDRYIIRFSPWDTVADGDPRRAFLRLLRDEFRKIREELKKGDPVLRKKVGKLLTELGKQLEKDPVKLGLNALIPGLGTVGAPMLGGLTSLAVVLMENADLKGDGKQDDTSAIQKARKEMAEMLSAVARAHGKSGILLLVDDLDRARPEEAVDILDSLYHLLMPSDDPREGNWPLTSVWAVNTAVLEEYLYREYRDLPSFDPNAYLEKLFSKRINVPPLFFERGDGKGSSKLWKGELGEFVNIKDITAEELAGQLAEQVNYAILGNLRLHARLRRDCRRWWEKNRPETTQAAIRDARLMVLICAFPVFRERIAPFNGMWPVFLNQMNRRLAERAIDWIANPLYRHVDSPDLATVLEDLGAIRYQRDKNSYDLTPHGREQLQKDLFKFWGQGF